jgi:hypothetical protein
MCIVHHERKEAMMSKMYRVLALGMAMALLCGVPAFVMANGLTAPTGVTCGNDGTTISADWDDLPGAVKYSAEFIVSYDTDGDTSTVEATLTFEQSTFTSDVNVLLSNLAADTNLDTVPDTIVSVEVRVKGLSPGKNQGRQNNPFSGLVDCGVTPP